MAYERAIPWSANTVTYYQLISCFSAKLSRTIHTVLLITMEKPLTVLRISESVQKTRAIAVDSITPDQTSSVIQVAAHVLSFEPPFM